MAESDYTRKNNEVTAPQAGQISVYAGNTATSSQDLSLCGPQTANASNADAQPAVFSSTGLNGCINRYVEFYADGVDFGILFGPSNAAVTGNNAPNLTQTGTDVANGSGACCLRIPAGSFRSFYIHGPARWIGFTASANTGYLRISPTSR